MGRPVGCIRVVGSHQVLSRNSAGIRKRKPVKISVGTADHPDDVIVA